VKAVVSRVENASVTVDGQVVGEIGRGLLVYVGVVAGDAESDADWLADKLIDLRIFPDEAGRMNRSTFDLGGGLLLIPNFTLAGRTKKGTRPSFTDAADPAVARSLFERLAARCAGRVTAAAGVFGAHMSIASTADGPVTLALDTRR